MVRRRLSGRCRTAYHYRVKAGIMLEAALTAATARSVCGSSPRNGYFRGYHTNTARGESKTPISRNRGEIGGSVREHVPKEPRERNGIIESELGLWIDRREWRDVPIIETPAHNPKVGGSNPPPATKITALFGGLFYCRNPAHSFPIKDVRLSLRIDAARPRTRFAGIRGYPGADKRCFGRVRTKQAACSCLMRARHPRLPHPTSP